MVASPDVAGPLAFCATTIIVLPLSCPCKDPDLCRRRRHASASPWAASAPVQRSWSGQPWIMAAAASALRFNLS